MEQRCYLGMIWLTWIGLPLVAALVGIRAGVTGGVTVLVVGVVAQVLYIRWFPRLSRWMGYGSVADKPAERGPTATAPICVTLYTANLCPFCPIVRQRLHALQHEHKFEIREIDVTFRPDLIRAKRLRSVPVLEANGRFLVGNATSAQIMDFLNTAPQLSA